MRFIFLIIAILTFSSAFTHAQENVQLLTSESNMLIINESNRIQRIDTVCNDSTSIQEIIGYDGWNQIVKKEIRNIHSSLGLMGLRTEVFDINGNLFLEQIENHDGLIWHQYIYTYDEQNRIKTKMGFSSGEIGHRIEFKYNRKGEMKKQIEYRFGEKVKTTKTKKAQ